MSPMDTAAAVAMFRRLHAGLTPINVATSADGRFRATVHEKTDFRNDRTSAALTITRAGGCVVAKRTFDAPPLPAWSPTGATLYIVGDNAIWPWTPRMRTIRRWHAPEHGVDAVIPIDERSALVVEPDATHDDEPRLRYPMLAPMATIRRTPSGRKVGRVEASATSFTLSGDGRRLAYVVPPTPYSESVFEQDLRVMTVATGKVRSIAPGCGAVQCLSRPTGDELALIDRPEGLYGRGLDLKRVSLRRGAVVNYSRTYDVSCNMICGWTADGCIVASAWEGLSSNVYAFAPDGSRKLLHEGRSGAVDVAGGQVITYAPGGLDAIALFGRRPKRGAGLRTPQPVTWKSRDGWQVTGVLIEPAGRRKPWPLFVDIHGGPANPVSDHPTYDMWMQPLAAAGCAVLVPAFRGGEGFGRAHLTGNAAHMGQVALDDCLAGVDMLARRGIVDRKRVAIGGCSYGGYLALYALSRTRRFKAGVCINGIHNAASDAANTQRGRFAELYLRSLPWEDPQAYADAGASGRVTAIRDPVLLLHGETDTNTPLSNATEAAWALRRLGVPHRFKTYPGEGHAISKPQARLDVMREMAAWLDEHL